MTFFPIDTGIFCFIINIYRHTGSVDIMYNILIVEDDAKQAKGLVTIINNYNTNLKTYIATDYHQALDIIRTHTFNLFILDIELGETSGKDGVNLGIAIRTRSNYEYAPIMFITAMNDRICEAVNTLHCYSYISKPYSDSDVIAALDSILNSPLVKESHIILTNLHGIGIQLKESDICYFKANGRIVDVYTTLGLIETREFTLDAFEKMLSIPFIRCHRKYIVNSDYCNNYDKTNELISCHGETIPVGRSYKNGIREHFKKIYNGGFSC